MTWVWVIACLYHLSNTNVMDFLALPFCFPGGHNRVHSWFSSSTYTMSLASSFISLMLSGLKEIIYLGFALKLVAWHIINENMNWNWLIVSCCLLPLCYGNLYNNSIFLHGEEQTLPRSHNNLNSFWLWFAPINSHILEPRPILTLRRCFLKN